MKTLSEICQLVKKEYVKKKRYDIFEQKICSHSGMCSALAYLRAKNKLSSQDKDRFMIEYRKFTENRRVFYNYDGFKTDYKSQFAWKVSNRAARIKWLDQRI